MTTARSRRPARLEVLLDRHHSGGSVPQQPICWPRARWVGRLPDCESVLNALPACLDRKSVRDVARHPDGDDAAMRGFLASMVWGYGDVGYGPWRIQRCLASRPDLPAVLLEAARYAAGDAEAAYEFMAGHRARMLGPAFATKYLYFSQPRGTRSPLILDRLVSDWLGEQTGLRFSPVRWSPRTYAAYLLLMRQWGDELGQEPALLEELMFRDRAGGQWHDPIGG